MSFNTYSTKANGCGNLNCVKTYQAIDPATIISRKSRQRWCIARSGSLRRIMILIITVEYDLHALEVRRRISEQRV